MDKTKTLMMVGMLVTLTTALPVALASSYSFEAVEVLQLADKACADFCKECLAAYQKACGGTGSYDCDQHWYNHKCYCEFDCGGGNLVRLEDVI